jgi:prepilin-type N-terminal cleavage/methylation domain-containing protein
MTKENKMLIKSKGFTLIEMSIVLIIIGLILGAVTIGKDVQRNAAYQKISQSFVQGWALAYQSHFDRVNIVIADDPLAPTLQVNQNNGEVCGAALQAAMDAAGVRMPQGRAEGSEDRAVYLDSNGVPQQMDICFDNIPWSTEGLTAGTYQSRNRNVMVLKGVTPDLARLLDSSIDGIADARFGDFRESIRANDLTATQRVWSKTNQQDYNDNATNRDESQIAIVTAYYLMPQ